MLSLACIRQGSGIDKRCNFVPLNRGEEAGTQAEADHRFSSFSPLTSSSRVSYTSTACRFEVRSFFLLLLLLLLLFFLVRTRGSGVVSYIVSIREGFSGDFGVV